MRTKAQLKNLRISPRKVRLVTNLIKGMAVENALTQLRFSTKKSSRDVEKLLRSAIANARNNFGLNVENLYISDIQVGEGPTLKRWLPRAFGRATQLLKRSSHIYIVLDEKVEEKVKTKKTETTEEGKSEKKSEPKKKVSEGKKKTTQLKASVGKKK